MKSNRKNKKRLNMRWKVERAKIIKIMSDKGQTKFDDSIKEMLFRLEIAFGNYPVAKLVVGAKRKKDNKIDLKQIRYRAYFKNK